MAKTRRPIGAAGGLWVRDCGQMAVDPGCLFGFFCALGFPGLEFDHFGVALGHFLQRGVVAFLLFRLEQGADGLLVLGFGRFQFVLHGFLFGRRQFVHVALGDGAAAVHLLAHQLADALALLLAQVQLFKHLGTVLAAVLAALVVHERPHDVLATPRPARADERV